jgi:hypothetical protein
VSVIFSLAFVLYLSHGMQNDDKLSRWLMLDGEILEVGQRFEDLRL